MTTRFAPEVLEYLRSRVRRDSLGNHWSLREASRRCERLWGCLVSPGQLKDYEKGVHVPGADKVASLADLYQVPVGALFVRYEGVPERMAEDEIRAHLEGHGVIQ